MSPRNIPVNLIEKSFLAEVPAEIYGARVTRTSGKTKRPFLAKLLRSPEDRDLSVRYRTNSSARFNVGGWVALPFELRNPVSLCIVYTDREGDHAILIDEMEARGASQVLLSGIVEVTAAGPIRSIKIYCGGIDDERVHIVDLHIQKIETQSERLALVS